MKLKIRAHVKKAYSEASSFHTEKKILVEGFGEVPVVANIGWDSDGSIWSWFSLDFNEWANEENLHIPLPYGRRSKRVREDVRSLGYDDMSFYLGVEAAQEKLPTSIPYKKVKAIAMKEEGIDLDNFLSKPIL